MRTSPTGVGLIKRHEGLALRAYPDPVGVWTNGYGHTRGVHPDQLIDEVQAERWLREDLLEVERVINAAVRVPLTQAQFDALASWQFNTGGLLGSTLLKRLNAGRYDLVDDEMLRWVYGTKDGVKVKLPGLIRRRAEEASLWIQGTRPRAVASNLEAGVVAVAPSPLPLSRSRTMQGAALASAGVAAQEVSNSLAPASEASDWIRVLCALVMVAGVVLVVWGRLREREEFGL